MATQLAPYLKADDKVILFDGVCKLCNAWSNFIITHDRRYIFKLCSVQSVEGQAILSHYGLPTQSFETMLYIEGERIYTKSDAFIRIVSQLKYPWRAASLLQFIPSTVRDWLYDRIALNRYRLFGKYDFCVLPSPDHDRRYIRAK